MLEKTSKIISNELKKEVHIYKVIDGKKSESTDSFYYIFKLDDGRIVEFSISDHFDYNHSSEMEYSLDNTDFINVLYELDDITNNVISDYPSGILDDNGYYDVEVAEKYDVKEIDLVGKSSVDRALAGQTYEITSFELLYNDQVLKVTYNDEDVDYYINYLPISDLEEDLDTAIAASIYKHFENPKKVYYDNSLTVYSEDEVNDDENIKENIFDENGDLYDDDVDVVKIFGKNYYVCGYDAPDL